jgi:hypothetical protein
MYTIDNEEFKNIYYFYFKFNDAFDLNMGISAKAFLKKTKDSDNPVWDPMQLISNAPYISKQTL